MPLLKKADRRRAVLIIADGLLDLLRFGHGKRGQAAEQIAVAHDSLANVVNGGLMWENRVVFRL